MKRTLYTLALTIIAAFLAAPGAIGESFSADVVMTSPAGSYEARMYVADGKVRLDTPQAVTITRVDKKVVWVLMPGQGFYMEQPFDPRNTMGTEEKLEGEIDRKLVGDDIVDGSTAKKYKVSYESGGMTASVYQWMREGLAVPVKTAAIDGSWSMEYRGLKTGPQPDGLFEIPQGYQKFSLGNMASSLKHLMGSKGAE